MATPTPPPSTQDRLNAYYQAEFIALTAIRTGHGDRTKEMAALEEIRRGIKELQAQIANEQRNTAAIQYGRPPLQVFKAGFNSRFVANDGCYGDSSDDCGDGSNSVMS